MWREYGGEKTRESIAIETTVGRLKRVHRNILSETISYFNEGDYNQEMYWFPTLFKQQRYSHEREFRAGIYLGNPHDHVGINLPIKLDQLIQKIYLHPEAKPEYHNNIRIEWCSTFLSRKNCFGIFFFPTIFPQGLSS